jgi:hypothetical protein
MRNVNWMMLIISIIVSAPCIAIAASQVKYGNDLDQYESSDYKTVNPYPMMEDTTGTSYAARLSVGTMFRNPYNATYNVFWSSDPKSNLARADVVVFL